MSNFLWSSAEEKAKEWALAKKELIKDGKLLPDGTKLLRNDHPGLKHSFVILEGKIIALSEKKIALKKGSYAQAMLAEDEAGRQMTFEVLSEEKKNLRETLHHELGLPTNSIIRFNSEKSPEQYFIAYDCLGISLDDYIKENPAVVSDLDACYKLSIKIALALHHLHKKGYSHNNIGMPNVVVDEKGEPHLIDFSNAKTLLAPHDEQDMVQYKEDIYALLDLFFLRWSTRDKAPPLSLFSYWIKVYEFSCGLPPSEKDVKEEQFYIYIKPEDKNADGSYAVLHYTVKDLQGKIQNGVLKLDSIQFKNITPKKEYLEKGDFNWEQYEAIKEKIKQNTDQQDYTTNSQMKNKALNTLLLSSHVANMPTAFETAETLTLCRFQLEALQEELSLNTLPQRTEFLQILNSNKVSGLFNTLNEKLNTLSKNTQFNNSVRAYLISYLKGTKGIFPEEKGPHVSTIKNDVEKLIKAIDQEKKALVPSEKKYADNLAVIHFFVDQINKMPVTFENIKEDQIVDTSFNFRIPLYRFSENQDLIFALRSLAHKPEYKKLITDAITAKDNEIKTKELEARNSYHNARMMIYSYQKQISELPVSFSTATTPDEVKIQKQQREETLKKIKDIIDNKPDLEETQKRKGFNTFQDYIDKTLEKFKTESEYRTEEILKNAKSRVDELFKDIKAFNPREKYYTSLQEIQDEEQDNIKKLHALVRNPETLERDLILAQRPRNAISEALCDKEEAIKATTRTKEVQFLFKQKEREKNEQKAAKKQQGREIEDENKRQQQKLLEEEYQRQKQRQLEVAQEHTEKVSEAQKVIESCVNQIREFSFAFTTPTNSKHLGFEENQILGKLNRLIREIESRSEYQQALLITGEFNPLTLVKIEKEREISKVREDMDNQITAKWELVNSYLKRIDNITFPKYFIKSVTYIKQIAEKEHNLRLAIEQESSALLRNQELLEALHFLGETGDLVLTREGECRTALNYMKRSLENQAYEQLRPIKEQTLIEKEIVSVIERIDEFVIEFMRPTSDTLITLELENFSQRLKDIPMTILSLKVRNAAEPRLQQAMEKKIKLMTHTSDTLRKELKSGEELINNYLEQIKNVSVHFTEYPFSGFDSIDKLGLEKTEQLRYLRASVNNLKQEEKDLLAQLEAILKDPKALEKALSLSEKFKESFKETMELKKEAIGMAAENNINAQYKKVTELVDIIAKEQKREEEKKEQEDEHTLCVTNQEKMKQEQSEADETLRSYLTQVQHSRESFGTFHTLEQIQQREKELLDGLEALTKDKPDLEQAKKVKETHNLASALEKTIQDCKNDIQSYANVLKEQLTKDSAASKIRLEKNKKIYEKYNKTIDVLLNKIEEFKDRKSLNTDKEEEIVNELHSELCAKGKVLFTKPHITKHDLMTFQSEAQDLIKKARESELKNQRGWVLILTHIAAFIGTAGVGYLAGILIDYAVNKRFTLFETKTVKELHTLEEKINEQTDEIKLKPQP